MSSAPQFVIAGFELFERPVELRLPFRFGAATVHEAPQAFARARIRLPDGRTGEGMAAELMVPKWFDKSPGKTNAQNIDDLRLALANAAAAYAGDTQRRTAFGHAASHYDELQRQGAHDGLDPLTASYGGALADRAILDALCRALAVDFFRAIHSNLPGLDAALAPDLAAFDIDGFLATLTARATIAARHTVGLIDPLSARDVTAAAGPSTRDALPVHLVDVIARYGHRYFKLKLGGDPQNDVARLARIATVLDTLPQYAVTLDGNEQYDDLAAIATFWRLLAAQPHCDRLRNAVRYLEQPLPRDRALSLNVREAQCPVPIIIDESDATFAAFPAARAAGYRGVSSKNCKGFYKSLCNAARCSQWNAQGDPRYFMSGEDLTAQAGLAVQQDLALVALLGLDDVERNGHHYVDGFAGQHAPATEQQAFLAAHPDLYELAEGGVRLTIRDGALALNSLTQPGYASAAWPDMASLDSMQRPALAPDARIGGLTRTAN